MKLMKENTINSKGWLWGIALFVTAAFFIISLLVFAKTTHSDEPVADFLVTTRNGELLEVDIDTGSVRLLGDAGYFQGRELGWSSLSFDSEGRLFVTSRSMTELSRRSHLYRVDPSNGAILEEIGSTFFKYVSDIEFGLDGSLYGSYSDDDFGVLVIDPATAISTPLLDFDDDIFLNGAISVHPMTGELWSVENNNSAYEKIFRLDYKTAALIEGSTVRLGLDGVPTDFGFASLTITPDGRFFGIGGKKDLRIGGENDPGMKGLYEIDPVPDEVSGLAEITRIPLNFPEELSSGTVTGVEFIFQGLQGLEVDIDINPEDPDNRVRLSNKGKLTVAILSSDSFDALTIDPTTVVLAGSPVVTKKSGKLAASFEDVNNDLLMDLVVHVATKDLKVGDTGTVAVLYGQTFDGTFVRGVDLIDVVSR